MEHMVLKALDSGNENKWGLVLYAAMLTPDLKGLKAPAAPAGVLYSDCSRLGTLLGPFSDSLVLDSSLKFHKLVPPNQLFFLVQ